MSLSLEIRHERVNLVVNCRAEGAPERLKSYIVILCTKEVCAVFEVLCQEVLEMTMRRNSMIGQ